ncbi:MAG: hypothetical protein PHQ18_02595 [Patescibacteria group bacterium]|nr:hypothetical protein [Patescibacteria group bacterium]
MSIGNEPNIIHDASLMSESERKKIEERKKRSKERKFGFRKNTLVDLDNKHQSFSKHLSDHKSFLRDHHSVSNSISKLDTSLDLDEQLDDLEEIIREKVSLILDKISFKLSEGSLSLEEVIDFMNGKNIGEKKLEDVKDIRELGDFLKKHRGIKDIKEEDLKSIFADYKK